MSSCETGVHTLETLRATNARLKQERLGMQRYLSLQAENVRLREQRAVIETLGLQLMHTIAAVSTTMSTENAKSGVVEPSPEMLRRVLQDVTGIKTVFEGILAEARSDRPGSVSAANLSPQTCNDKAVAAYLAVATQERGQKAPAYVPGKKEMVHDSLVFRDNVAYVPEPAALEDECADTFSWSTVIESGHSSSEPEADSCSSKSKDKKMVPRMRTVSSMSTVCSLVEQSVESSY
eukprot:TRINITY_DN90785_c0_g1_i1.p1 TRINITY_DN90785_c0_g1~~TRINITY_DN90785_c0_g1_i1.p1  ORF type:complete len:235 (+),score=26.34 TRINITY_DN90785_c0_g1_i1:193-897(+)